MNLLTAASLSLEVARLRRHERWPRRRLLEYQAQRLAAVRDHALRTSPFYRRFHGAAAAGPLQGLPVLTKAIAMEAFDEIVTDPRVRLDDVRRHLLAQDPRPYLGQCVLLHTSGSTGEPGVFVMDRRAWGTVLAGLARSREWAGGTLRPWARTRTASVTVKQPASVSYQLATSLRSWWVPLLILDAGEPRSEIVRQLNAWQPEMVVMYPSVGRQLALEQLEGRLAINPRLIFTTAEVLTPHSRRLMARAFGREPFNRYSTCETGELAAECAEHRMHLCEDTAVIEVVDEQDRPVPIGEWGAKVLVTPFHNRLQPLIRYQLSDQIRLNGEPCPCGRPFLVVDEIRGRVEEVFNLPAIDARGRVDVHRFVFEGVLDDLPLAGLQLIQAGDAMTIRMERYRGELSDAAIAGRIADALRHHGARVSQITFEHVDHLPRGAGGKAPPSTRIDAPDATSLGNG